MQQKDENNNKYLKMSTETPVLFITYNRLDYTKKSLKSLLLSKCGLVYIFDNGSSDGTIKWLKGMKSEKIKVYFSKDNIGVSGAMNYFFSKTRNRKYVAKVDNDTVVRTDWLQQLIKACEEASLDMVQARHPILKTTHNSGNFDEWMKEKKQDKKYKSIFYSDHIGGSGVVIRRNVIKDTLKSKWVLGGWDKFQKDNPHLAKAFCIDTTLRLLDTSNGTSVNNKYSNYYKDTGRWQLLTIKEQKDWIEHLEKDVKELNNYIKMVQSSRLWRTREYIRKLLSKE